ncbi:shikimate O-hydroxycinnamoyltransferase-like isoform X1 [Pistacia vera]|uniref:shikimate O-hydroxycinnamoyltransferase-like isoform X1 n=1 Tax=Pistacia vera TaxID=55513 RepID=UPI001263E596|nr:shikimate O-hydroxycinnamoyltransferase-like isoform X1 [Pistacia vera]
MEIKVKETSVVGPAQETPKHGLWISKLDLLDIHRAHIPLVYFYRRQPSQTADRSYFFGSCVLKEALSKALVAFYPLAGRLGRDENGRLQIDCNGEGVLFMEAETSCAIEDDFTPSLKMRQLVPTIDYSTSDIYFYPLLLLQVTYFKCGGICLGIGWHHILGDGTSAFHFIKSWAEITSGFSISVPPFIDRTILHARIPPHPTFNHIEYHPPPSMDILESQSSPRPTSMARFRLPLDQINAFKAKLKNEHGATYSTFVILAAHIWRCVCKARGLPMNQSTKLYIPIKGRSRLNPPLPLGYLGNVIFTATPIALAGDIQSKPLIYTVKIIHEALKQMNDEYLRSTLAYAEQHYNNMMTLEQGVPNNNCPNLRIVSWARMPIYDADFGWGSPIFMGRATIPSEGASFILSSPSNERSLSLIICLETPHMELFKKLLYTEGTALMKKYYKPSSL